MKKILSLIALAMTIGMTSCSDDKCTHPVCPPPPLNPIEGMWYVEADNEEINYDGSGTFYDRYSNVELSNETEGRYEIDYSTMKLTYRYSFNGINETRDWTIKDFSEFGFKLSSSIATGLDAEKIVEQRKLAVGETVKLKFDDERADIFVSSYISMNEIIASVSSNGTVTAVGGKGTTYIKMVTNQGNVWAKITVGEDNKDLWCNYASLIGADYNSMKQYLSRLGEPATDGIDYFAYYPSVHQYIESVNIQIDTDRDFIVAVQLFIKEGIPPVEIKSYLKSRLYEHDRLYSTQPELETSKAVVIYDEENRCVTYFDPEFVFYPKLWQDFTKLFGCTQTDVKNAMDKYGYSYMMSDNSYSVDGSEYYNITDNKYLWMAGFVSNPDKQVSEYWLYLDSKSNPNEIYRYLAHYYNEDKTESTDYTFVFYNEDKSLRVVFDLVSVAVVYTKVTMKQHEANTEILGNYQTGIGATRNQILDKFGTPFDNGDDMIIYIVGSQYVDLAAFKMNVDTGKCKNVVLTINESAQPSAIVDYLGSKYTVFANGTAPDGSQYAWTDGPSVAESTLGIIYYPEDKMVVYQPLGSAASAKFRNKISKIIETDDNLIKQVKSKTTTFLNRVKQTKDSIKAK